MAKYLLAFALSLNLVALGQDHKKLPVHSRDYVPDERTAERIAEAVLGGQFGQERVNEQLPLFTLSPAKDVWLVQGTLHGVHGAGGNFGVWIDKHDGCVGVIEEMK
jgi:NTF2 fold immunity protein